MDGGLLQLIAKGSEDMPLINKPQFTPFKKIYKKTGIFSKMDSEVILDNLTFQKTILSKIPKIGDLISKVYLELNIPDFNLLKTKNTYSTQTIFSDNSFQLKQKIIKKILQIDNLQKLYLDDFTIINLSTQSLAKNLLLSYKNNISNSTNLYLDYSHNHQIISYLLTSNLNDLDLVIADFLLRYLEQQKYSINSGTDILQQKYNQLYQDLITNSFILFSNKDNSDYKLPDSFNQNIFNYLRNKTLQGELSFINDNISLTPLQHLKDILPYEFNFLTNYFKFLFPNDNFRNNSLDNTFILPFTIYLYFNPNNNNNIRFDITDKDLSPTKFLKQNINIIKNQLDITTPITQIIQETFEKYTLQTKSIFEAYNYQKMLFNPTKILATIIAITEIWKWQTFDFSSLTTAQIIPGLEGLAYSLSNPVDIQNYTTATNYFTNFANDFLKFASEYLTIDFERKKTMSATTTTDFTDLPEFIEKIYEQLKNITTYDINGISLSLNSNYLNRVAKDLNIILIYTFYLYKEHLASKNIFKSNSSISWLNFMNQSITNKAYTKWVGDFTTRIDETYVGVDIKLKDTGEADLQLDNKIPISILPNNFYQLSTDRIKELLYLQTHKYNYICDIDTSVYSFPDFDISLGNNKLTLKTIKTFQNINYTINEKNIIFSDITNCFYHILDNTYTLQFILNNTTFNYEIYYDRTFNNKLYFTFKHTSEYNNFYTNKDSISNINLISNIKQNVPIKEHTNTININTIGVSTPFTNEELEVYYFYKVYYDVYNNILDIKPIPKELVQNNTISNTFTFDSSIENINEDHFTINYVNQDELVNLYNSFDFNRDYYTYKSYDSVLTNGETPGGANDPFHKYTYLHNSVFILKHNSSDQFNIYHLPYKVNTQKYKDINITTQLYLENRKVNILGRFSNQFNLREDNTTSLGTEYRCYSEGIDFYDDNFDHDKFNIDFSLVEEDYLQQIDLYLQNLYIDYNKEYQQILDVIDFVNNKYYSNFYDSLYKIKNIGSIYENAIDKLLESNDLTLEQLKHFPGQSFKNNNYWYNQMEINDGTYLEEFFAKQNLTITFSSADDYFNSAHIPLYLTNTDLTSDLDQDYYNPNTLLNYDYLTNYHKIILKQIDLLESNFLLLNDFPQIINSTASTQNIQHIINKNFNTVNSKSYKYNIDKDTNITSDLLYINDEKITIDSDKIIVDSTNTIDNVYDDIVYKTKDISEETFPNKFYDYGIFINNKIIFLDNNLFNNTNKYTILNESLVDTTLTYSEITFDYIIFSDVPAKSLIDDNLIVLQDSDNYLPYGKLIPDLTNSKKYYRVGRNSKNQELLQNIISENVLLEKRNINFTQNTIFSTNITGFTTVTIQPVFHSDNLKLEYYTDAWSITTSNFSLSTSLKLNKYDFIYFPDSNTSIEQKWHMFNTSTQLNLSDDTGTGFYIFRFITKTSKNLKLFESALYDFTNITFNDMIVLTEELITINLENNKLIKNDNMEIGDYIIQNDGTDIFIQQITGFNDNVIIYPQFNYTNTDEPRLIKNIFVNHNLTELSSHNLNLNTPAYTFSSSYLFDYIPEFYPSNFKSDPWEYRNLMNGDLYFKDDTLELATSDSTEQYIYESINDFIKFTGLGSNWYQVDKEFIMDSTDYTTKEIDVGDIVYDLTELSNSDYETYATSYVFTGDVQARVLAKKGKYVLLSASISDNTFLVKKYPVKIETQINSDNILYSFNSGIYIEKINLDIIKFNSKKYRVNVSSNILTVISGYDNNTKNTITFAKTDIKPQQEFIIDDEIYKITNYSTMQVDNIYGTNSDKNDVIMYIPDTISIKNISKTDNININYLDELSVGDTIDGNIILIDNGITLNYVSYSEKLKINDIYRNILELKFTEQTTLDKFIKLFQNEQSSSEPFITEIFVNINNKVIYSASLSYDIETSDGVPYFDLNKFSIYLYITKPFNFTNDIILLQEKEQNIENYQHILYSNWAYEKKFILANYNINNYNINSRNHNYNLYNHVNTATNTIDYGISFNSYSYYPTKTNNQKLISYQKNKNNYIQEFIEYTLSFSNTDVEIVNNQYRIKLLVNTLDVLDDQKLFIFQNNQAYQCDIILESSTSDYYIVSDIIISKSTKFYQKILHKINYLIEDITDNNITTKNKYYLHNKITYSTTDNNSEFQYIKIIDYVDTWDFSMIQNAETPFIINTNFNYHFGHISLPVHNILPGLDLEEGTSGIRKKTFKLEIDDNNYDYLNKTYGTITYPSGDEEEIPVEDILIRREEDNIEYKETIYNEMEYEKNNLIEYSKINYLLVKLVDNMDWNKLVRLSNSYKNGVVEEDIVEIGTETMIINTYFDKTDYELLYTITPTLEQKTKQDFIIDVCKDIYTKINVWLFQEDFISDPDKFLNNYLKKYNLQYNNKFTNLDGTNYIEFDEINKNIPTYINIIEDSSSYYFNYIINYEDLTNNYTLLQPLFDNTFNKSDIIQLTNFIDFYSFWDIIKLNIKIYDYNEIYGTNNINLYFEQINKLQILNIFDDYKLSRGIPSNINQNNNNTKKINYTLNDTFDYLIKLNELPDNSELNELDFKETKQVFYDPESNKYNNSGKRSVVKLDNYIPNQNVDLYGQINYNILNSTFIGQNYNITLEANSIPDSTFNLILNNQNINYDTSNLTNPLKMTLEYIPAQIEIHTKIIITFRNGKYLLPDIIIPWLEENKTFIKTTNNGTEKIELLEFTDNQIISPKPQNNVLTLIKYADIVSSSSLTEYVYEIELDDTLNYEPAFGHKIKNTDLLFGEDYPTSFNDNIFVFDKEKTFISGVDNLKQRFKLNNTGVYDIKSDLSKTFSEYAEDKVIRTVNDFNIIIKDINDKEIGNYIYSVDIDNTNTYNDTFYFEDKLFGKLIGDNVNGYYFVSLEELDNISYKIYELNSNICVEISNLEYKNKSYFEIIDKNESFSDMINVSTVLFNIYLEEKLFDEEIKNVLYDKVYDLSFMTESETLEIEDSEIVSETPDFVEELGFYIVENMAIKVKNHYIEEIDCKMLKQYYYYFVKESLQKGIQNMMHDKTKLIIPLPFWFTLNDYDSLPIVLSNETDFYIEFTFNKLNNIVLNSGDFINKPKFTGKLVYESIWLGDDEKQLMSKKPQEYLITTFKKAQTELIDKNNLEINLKFTGAVKDFFFAFYLKNNRDTFYQDEQIDDTYYNNYINEKNTNSAIYQELIEYLNNTAFLDNYQDIINFYNTKLSIEKEFIVYLINNIFLQQFTSITKSRLFSRLGVYFSKYYKKSSTNTIYPLNNASLNINGYQYIRNKSDLFWSSKNQLNYSQSGNQSYYGYTFSLFPLSTQPSGHFNHNIMSSDSVLKLNINNTYLQNIKNNNDYANLHIYYRKYKLLGFMSNQAGVFFE